MTAMNTKNLIQPTRIPRLFVDAPLAAGATASLGPESTHYLLRVLRLTTGATIHVFNGADGLWEASLAGNDRRRHGIEIGQQIEPQPALKGPWLAFAVPKRHALEMIVQKAVELGVARLIPVETERAMHDRLNLDRLLRIAVEAAEQCERLTIPAIVAPLPLAALYESWPAQRTMFGCDETGGGDPLADAADALLGDENDGGPQPDWGLMIGPEGGFAVSELDGLSEVPFVKRVTLGPRILRAETAALAGLAIGQAFVGDGDMPVRGAA